MCLYWHCAVYCYCAERPFQRIPLLISSTGPTVSRSHQATSCMRLAGNSWNTDDVKPSFGWNTNIPCTLLQWSVNQCYQIHCSRHYMVCFIPSFLPDDVHTSSVVASTYMYQYILYIYYIYAYYIFIVLDTAWDVSFPSLLPDLSESPTGGGTPDPGNNDGD